MTGASSTPPVGSTCLREGGRAARETTPYTLHPTPYTLHPTLYTLHPAPYTLHPTPSARPVVVVGELRGAPVYYLPQVPQEQKLLKGHLPRVIHYQVY